MREDSQKLDRLQALEQLADVYAALEPRDALPVYEEALALWQSIAGDRVTGVRLRRKLAELAAEWAGSLGLAYDQERTGALIETGLSLLGDDSPGTERVRLLIARATNAYRYRLSQDYETALQSAQEAAVLAERLGAIDELTSALRLLGEIYRRKGSLSRAGDVLCTHLEVIEQKAGLERRAEIHRQLGLVLGFLGEYSQAIEYLELARQEHERAGSVLLACSSQLFITYFYLQWDRWPEAFQSGVRTIELRREHGLGPYFAALMLARVHAVWGDADGVEKRRLETLEERDELDPRTLSYLSAQINLAQGDFGTALQIFEDALTIAAPSFVFDHAITPYLAECAARTGDGESALHYATQAETVARQGGSKPWLARAVRAQGLVHMAREEWKRAEAGLGEALAAFQEMGCRWEEGRALVDLARLYRGRDEGGDRKRAWRHYQDALNCFEDLWARPDAERVQREMLDL